MAASENTLKQLTMLLRMGVGITDASSEKTEYEKESIEEAYKLAKHHDLAHVVANAVKKNALPCPEELFAKLDKQQLVAIFRYQHQKYDLGAVNEAFEKAEIPHVPLKGSVLRRYYSPEWLRTGCDIDILIKPEDIDRAVSVLTEKLSFKYDHKSSHDVTLISPGGTSLELHYDLIEKDEHGEDEVLEGFWESATPVSGREFTLEVSDEMFYYYHVGHMAKHFMNGGCGIRPFLDLWTLNNKLEFSRNKRDEIMRRGNYFLFGETATRLSEVWFGNAEHSDLTKKMEEYILSGGVYGNTENRIAVQTAAHGSRFSYILSKIFLPYRTMKFYYPIVNGRRWLMPFCQVRRWCRLIFCGGLGRSVKEMKVTGSVTSEEKSETAAFLSDLGLGA